MGDVSVFFFNTCTLINTLHSWPVWKSGQFGSDYLRAPTVSGAQSTVLHLIVLKLLETFNPWGIK